MMLGNVIRLPLIFVSGIIIPLQDLPNWGRAIAVLSPLTYANNLMSQSATSTAYLSASANTAALFAFWAVFLLPGVKLYAMRKKV